MQQITPKRVHDTSSPETVLSKTVAALLMVLITGRRGRRAKIQLNSETSR